MKALTHHSRGDGREEGSRSGNEYQLALSQYVQTLCTRLCIVASCKLHVLDANRVEIAVILIQAFSVLKIFSQPIESVEKPVSSYGKSRKSI